MSEPHAGDAPHEEQKVAERQAIGAHVIHEAIRREGEEELERPAGGLFWSGLAAGLSMGLSLAAAGLLHAHLPDAPWRPLVAHLGYTVGFLVVILGRQQLFTENTLTPVLPLLARPSAARLGRVARLWAVVLGANLLGTLLFAAGAAFSGVFDEAAHAAFRTLSWEQVGEGFLSRLSRGIYAGWIVALLVWMLGRSTEPQPVVIAAMTYLLALGGFAHIIAGAVDAFYLALTGELSWTSGVPGFGVPTLIGNVLGGVSLVAALNHAQVVGSGRSAH
jgi:formate/nitrite transporter FocA (FNT family)